MPEGDTIHRAANRLREALAGRQLVSFRATKLQGVRPRPDAVIDDVEARGKHLLIRFTDGLVLQTHMMMTGAWHVYAPGERWRRPEHVARVVIDVGDAVAVCFQAPVIRTYMDAADSSPVDHLGPDLCDPNADLDEALRRLDRYDPRAEIACVLVDQRVAAGIGNVYKSEVLFAARIDPTTPLGQLDRAARRALLTIAAGQLQANIDRAARATHPLGYAVYGRYRKPCRVCETPIRWRRQGDPPRTTYWCPKCQTIVK